MQKLWNWLNGNKTVFGLAILAITGNIAPDANIIGIPIQPILNWLGGILTGTGVVHKIAKSNTQPGPNV